MASSSSRPDRRQPNELRPISISLGQLARADGSARFAFGSTAALASFSGPIEVRLREELPERATLEVIHRPLEGVGATPSRALETSLQALLKPILHLSSHPRSLVQIVVQSLSTPSSSYHKNINLNSSYPSSSASGSSTTAHTWPKDAISKGEEEDDGYVPLNGNGIEKGVFSETSMTMSEKAAAINAVSLAALDSGSIAMKGVPIAVSLAKVPRRSNVGFGGSNGEVKSGVLVLDPSEDEERSANSRFGFGWVSGVWFSTVLEGSGDEKGGMEVDGEEGESSEMELVWVESEGSFSKQDFDEALSASKAAASQILQFVREKMEEKFERRR